MMARVQDNGEMSHLFSVSSGVKQGCVLAPTLLSVMLSVMLTDSLKNTDVAIGKNYCTARSVFNN